MSTPRFYSWDDDGSPGRNLSGNNQNRLKQILVPCLVTGYGDKPGAGWTLEHEHANGFTLSNGHNYINFVSNLPAMTPYPAMNSYVVHIYAAESLTDTSGAIIDGANLCSGTFRKGIPEDSRFPRHLLGYVSRPLDSQVTTLQWTLVADDKTFTLNCSSSSSIDSAGSGPNYAFTFYAGEANLDAHVTGNFVALGGDIGSYNSSPNIYALGKGYTAPIDLFSSLAQTVNVGSEPYSSTYALGSDAQPGKSLARLNLQQPRLFFADNFLGRLRGVVYDDVLRNYGWQEHLKVLGFSGSDFTDRGKLVEIDGYNYAFARSASGNSILTDNPAFW